MVKIILAPLFILLVILFAQQLYLFLQLQNAKRSIYFISLLGLLTTSGLYLASLPITTSLISKILEAKYRSEISSPMNYAESAVVVLGGGIYKGKHKDEDRLTQNTWLRVLEGIRYFKKAHIQSLIMAGRTKGTDPERMVILMKNMAIKHGIPSEKILLEPRARNTYEHPIELKKLKAINPDTFLVVVTSAWHLPRAMCEFKRNFLNAYGIPSDSYKKEAELGLYSFLPNLGSLGRFTDLIHEYIGSLWYAIRHLKDNNYAFPFCTFTEDN